MGFIARIRNLRRRENVDTEIAAELRAHVEMAAEEMVRDGMSEQEARRVARLRFGNPESVREKTLGADAALGVGDFGRDVKFALRQLRKSPGFAATAVTTLALGIGATTAMFSLLNQVVLRLLPVKHPEQLVMVTERGNTFSTSYGATRLSWPMYEDLRDHNHVFSGMFCRFPIVVALGFGDQSEQINAELVSGSYFPVLGVDAALGRTIAPEDDAVPDSHPVVVLSYGFWQSYFHGDRTIVGRTIGLNGYRMTVIGVAQPGFDGVEFGSPAKVFVPMMMKTEMTPYSDGIKDRRRRYTWLAAYGRLKPGISTEQAQQSLQPLLHNILAMEVQDPFFRQYTAADRAEFLRNRIELLPGSTSVLRNAMRRPLWLLVALTGAVLLLACANLANLLLARATAREREFAVRLAMGAGRRRIVRQLLVESLLLSGAGAALGLALAILGDRILLNIYLPADAAAEFAVSAIPDWRVLAFAVSTMLITGLAFGLLPAMSGSRTEVTLALRDRSGAGSAGAFSLRRTLVGVQVALSLVLLAGAGLFVRTLRNLQDQGPGFPTDHLLTFSVNPSLSGYNDAATESYFERLNLNLQAMPGVASVGLSTMPILTGHVWQNPIVGKGFEAVPKQDQPVLSQVGPDYFSTLGIPLLAGRDFTTQDRGPAGYAVVNEAFARIYLRAGNPIGQRFGLLDDIDPAQSRADIQVIGVIRDTKCRDLRETPPPQAFFSYFESVHFRGMNFYLRTRSDPRELENALRERVHQFDPRVPMVGLETMDEELDFSLRSERLVASLSGVFGGLATLLAVIGLYGTMAWMVARRTREMGIRIALGAMRGNVVGLVMREALVLIGSGLAAGGALALLLAGLIRSQLYGLDPHDPPTLVAAALALLLAAGLAGLVPALRASRVDPMQALRSE
jgi:predicted permease